MRGRGRKGGKTGARAAIGKREGGRREGGGREEGGRREGGGREEGGRREGGGREEGGRKGWDETSERKGKEGRVGRS